ncbi:S-adenosyl-L-methionine:benzoic acid/salicylic acid carboxyl methyltransferase 3-like [Rutidosis leptorrhynchoides]|uniref:S-adenosyl-L-methionine:benzoic acid/salicylic acid carboxyl methyltransferase 3-like n=1 Tax=Rutidosis leptorrhynchoides TaxID=125765 RepID=UPI003A98D273
MVFGKCFTVADLGCSSGTNTLLVASNIIDMILKTCKEHNLPKPQLQICLNDLYVNDFNSILKLLPEFQANHKKKIGEDFAPCFVSAVPGSFYGRLFPDKSLNLVYSSYSIHWLSQVPAGLENNTSNIYISKTSPPSVFEAYHKQFYDDFMKFLQMRSKEMVRGGRMALIFIGRSIADPTSDDCCSLLDLLAVSLSDMVKEGLVRESELNSFNIPVYTPYEDEVRQVIQNEGSFSLDSLSDFRVNWDSHDTDYINMKDSSALSDTHGENTAKMIRAVMEPLMTSHFGNSIIDVAFKKYAENVSKHLVSYKSRHFNLVITLAKK